MNYKRKSSSLSVTESEQFYTPYHNYNTRLSAKNGRYRHSENLVNSPIFPNLKENQNEDTYLIEDFENSSDRFSVTSFKENSETFPQTETPEYYDRCLKSLVKVQKRMDFDEPPCIQDGRRKYWVKNGGFVLIAAIIGWYVNHIRIEITNMKSEISSANSRISDIVDARLDTLYKLSETASAVKELKQSQSNFKDSLQHMFENEINKLSGDKTGRTDFALESAGGRIVQLAPGTENYGQPKSSLLGISLCEGMHGPRSMIQTGTSPGECWALKGSNGGVLIKLLGQVKIDAVSLEHISKSISPSGDSTTAPKDFTVWALRNPTDRGSLLGQFSYDIEGPLVQMFAFPNPPEDSFEFVELRILSNHGNADFTCVYRFRVHGTMENSRKTKDSF